MNMHIFMNTFGNRSITWLLILVVVVFANAETRLVWNFWRHDTM